MAKKGLKELKGLARNCKSRGLNPHGWAYFGHLSAKVERWEAEACQASKEAEKEREERWLKWVEEAILGGAKAGHSFIKNLPK